MPYQSKDHNQNRKSVCMLCLHKCSCPVTAFQANRICQIYQTNLGVFDARVPQGLCESCHTLLRRKDEGKEVVLLKLFDFKTFCVRTETCDHLPLHTTNVQRQFEKSGSIRCQGI